MIKLKELIKSKELPLGFRLFNLIILAPIVLWPLVFFASIFMFDNPKNVALTFLFFILINAYPVYLFILARANVRLFKTRRKVAFILPSLFAVMLLLGCVKIIYGLKEDRARQKKDEDFLFARTPETISNIEYKDETGGTPLQEAVLLERYDAILHLLKQGADYNQLIVDRSQFNPDGRKMYLVDMLREDLPELNSKEHVLKMEIVDFLLTKGIDYKQVPIPDFIMKEIKEQHPKDWAEYVEKY